MALTLERIVYDKDSGSEAIKKLDRNQRMIVNDSANLGVQVADTVTSIETGANYNTIKVTKNDGTNEIISTNGITSYNNLSDLPDLSLKADANTVSNLQTQINEFINRGYTSPTYTQDIDSLVKNGKYILTNKANCPDGNPNSIWLIDVAAMTDDYVYQKAYCLYSASGNTTKTYCRQSTNGTWDAWQTIITENMIPTFSGGVGGGEGGEVHFAKGETDNLGADVTMDVCNNHFRIFASVKDQGLKIAGIPFEQLQTNVVNILATTETIPISNMTFLNGHSQFRDTGYGYIARCGKIVHVNFLLNDGNASAGSAIFKLPFTPIFNELHNCGGKDIRTRNDGYLFCNSPMSGTNSYIVIDFCYVCTGVV